MVYTLGYETPRDRTIPVEAGRPFLADVVLSMGRKERRGAEALVVMGHGWRAVCSQRQTRWSAIQCVNQTVLVYTEHQCFLWRIEIETYLIDKYLHKQGST